MLILASHHDDETLGCGATIARMADEGHDVRVLVLGEGPSARKGTDHRKAVGNSVSAIAHLGGHLHIDQADGLPDNQFDTVALLTIAQRIEAVIEQFQPEEVFTHHFGDINQDHRKVHEASPIVTRTYSSKVKRVYMYEIPGATNCSFRREDAFVPDVYQEVTAEQLNRKIQAMEMYETERRPFPHPRSPEALRALAMYRGSQAGYMAAEAFQLVREIR